MKTLIVTYKDEQGSPVYARTLMENAGGDVSWLIFGGPPYPSPKGSGKVYSYEGLPFMDEIWADVAVQVIKRENPSLVLFPASPVGKALAPRVSALLSTGTTADAMEVLYEDGSPVAVRSAFGGNVLAKIESKVLPHVVSMVSLFADESVELAEASAERLESSLSSSKVVKPLKAQEYRNPLQEARFVIGAGRGIGTEENFRKILKIAKKIGAAVGVTRPLVEYGWASEDMMVGQTGLTIKPRFYLAIGISGAFQHTVGVKAAKIMAVNKDPSAPIFSIADVKLVADAGEFIDALERKFLA